MSFGNLYYINLDPSRDWYPLRCECLKLFHGMVGGVNDESADEIEAFMVRKMRGGLLAQGSAFKILTGPIVRSNLV